MQSPQSSLDADSPLATDHHSLSKLTREDRVLIDRRLNATPFFSRYSLFGGRRTSGGQRETDCPAVFVDSYGPLLFFIVTSIVALNFLDAWFTILFLSYGGQELNPVMDILLQNGSWPFIMAKSVGIGFCVVVLTITKNFRIAKVGAGVVFCGYTVLLGWHLFLLQRLPL